MKLPNYLFALLLFCTHLSGMAQKNNSFTEAASSIGKLTIEPGIGIHTNFGTDFLLSTLIQWNPTKRLSLASYSSFNINNVFQRSFNHIETEYNYSLNQKFGAGTTFYSTKSAHTFLLLAGVKSTSFKETLDNPNFNKVSTSINSLSPDFGVMYSLKRGWKKYFLTGRFYLPLSPWLTEGANIENIQGTLRDVSIEFGVGIKIK